MQGTLLQFGTDDFDCAESVGRSYGLVVTQINYVHLVGDMMPCL
jgi:hypothetical protein